MRMTALLGLAVALTCVPAFAADGNVSQATLKALGLSGAEMLTDAQGMEVRGMASSASGGGLLLITGQLVGPDGNFVTGSFIDGAFASQNRRGGRRSRASYNFGGGFGFGLDIDTRPRFSGRIGGGGGGRGSAFAGFSAP